MSGRRELAHQNHIIDSYKECGGHAAKWASEWQKGKPDLICSTPRLGGHLMEVKHRPDWKRVCKNLLEPKQIDECKKYLDAGCRVVVGVVRGEKTIKSEMALFDPLSETFDPVTAFWVPYVPGKKYNINTLLDKYYGII